jgi:hypothetical protein
MTVHLFNWPVSPSYIGWTDPVKITASGGVLNFKADQNWICLFIYLYNPDIQLIANEPKSNKGKNTGEETMKIINTNLEKTSHLRVRRHDEI